MKSYAITGMTCDGCRSKVERTLKSIASDAVVTLDPPRATFASSISLASVNEALGLGGKYVAGEISAAPLSVAASSAVNTWLATYYPLLLILGLIALTSLAGQSWLMAFMAGFYIVFGAFKLLNVPAFARSYAQYDPIAMAFRPWAYAYPFIEIVLGLAFLFWYQMLAATWIALILSLVGAAGAIQSVKRKQSIQCACLGSVFNLPMSTVTIVENIGTAAMAAWMLIVGM